MTFTLKGEYMKFEYLFAKASKAILLRIAEEFEVSCSEINDLRATSFRKGDKDIDFVIFSALAKVLKGVHESGCPPSQKKGAVKQLLRIVRSYRNRQVPKV